MSKRSHHRSAGSFNINELAEALTRNGWQPPSPNPQTPPYGGNPAMNAGSPFGAGNSPISNNLSALGSLLGAVSGGSPPMTPTAGAPTGGAMPQMPQMPPMSPMMPGTPQMPINPMNPMNPMMPQPPMAANHGAATAKAARPTDLDLLKKLFQEVIKVLREP